MEYKISKESAQEQLALFVDSGVTELEDITDDAARKGIEVAHNGLRRAIRRGLLEISVDKEANLIIIQHLVRSTVKTITYKEMTGEAKLQMAKVANNDNYSRMYAILGYLSGLGIDAIKLLKGVDLSVAECLSAVFLAL
jgi:hypothetical protein